MRSILYAVFALGLVACADPGPGKVAPPWGDMVTADMTAPADMPDTEDMNTPQDMTEPVDMAQDMPTQEDDGPDCACTGETDCCDGCEPINAGGACDDGLECTLGTTCQDDGTCGASTISPCDEQLEHPDCQVAMCDEVAGCSSMPAREGFECGTPAAGTYDGVCESGVCVGQQQCECTEADGPCCDGCKPHEAGYVCDTAGQTVGCDGECGGEIVINRISYTCDGTSLECGSDPVLIEESRTACDADNLCEVDQGGTNQRCTPSADCPM